MRLQGCLAKAAKKTQQAPVEKSQLEELSAVAQNVVNNITTTLGINDLDSKKVVDIFNNQTQTLANNVQQIADKLKTEVSFLYTECIYIHLSSIFKCCVNLMQN